MVAVRMLGMYWVIPREDASMYLNLYRLYRESGVDQITARVCVTKMFALNCIDSRTVAYPIKKKVSR